MAQAVSELASLPKNDYLIEIDQIADRLENASAEESLGWAFDKFGETIVIATGFGAEGMALIDLAAKVSSKPDIFFIDTGFLFHETYELRYRLEERYGISIRAYQSDLDPEAQRQQFGDKLWASDPDLCCRIRKLEPLKDALMGRKAWITAIRGDQSADRASSRVVEWDYRWQLVKLNPLIRWSRQDVWDYIRANKLPYNPLHDVGYPSIGCTHCTRAVEAGEGERAGRWAGHKKTECGLHGGAGLIPFPVLGTA
jgi:phosphoadenosine phosphosulfate reductase